MSHLFGSPHLRGALFNGQLTLFFMRILETQAATESNRFVDEIVPVEIPGLKGQITVFSQDEFPRFGTTSEGLGKLRLAFKKNGSVTAGYASGINDGAAALVVMSLKKEEELGIKFISNDKSKCKRRCRPKYYGNRSCSSRKKGS